MKKFLFLLITAAIAAPSIGQKIVNDSNAEKRNVGSFHGVQVSGGIDLYLTQGDESVAVSASEVKHRDRIRTEVQDGILKIWYEYKDNSNMHIEWGNKKLKAYVSCRNIDKLIASGGSDVQVEGSLAVNSLMLRVSGGSDFNGKIESSALEVEASGGSDVNISGKADKLKINASGGSDFKGYELVSDICTLDASGGSDVYITVNKELNAEASGGSDVYYKGAGVIRDLKSGSSSSIKKVSK